MKFESFGPVVSEKRIFQNGVRTGGQQADNIGILLAHP